MKRISFILLSGACLLLQAPGHAQRKSAATLTIPFGKQNCISYQLQQGTYSVIVNGRTAIQNAWATCKGNSETDSRTATTHSYTKTTAATGAGKATVYTIVHQAGSNELQQLFYVYPGKDYVVTELRLKSQDGGCHYMSPLTTTQVTLPGKGDKRALQSPFDNDMWLRYNAPELGKAGFTGSEVTALYNNDTYAGLVLGSLEQDTWKTGIQVTAGSDSTLSHLSVFAGYTDSLLTHDLRPHGTVLPQNGYCRSPRILIGSFSDWRDGMEAYAQLNMQLVPRHIFSWKKATPMGWNSWGAIQDKINYDKSTAVVNYFHDSLKAFRNADNTLFMDLDSYWDNMMQGGLEGNITQLKQFVAYCKERGFKPGIYWAPFVDWGKSERGIEGSSWNYQQTWTTQKGKVVDTDGGRAMDPTHPGTRDRIRFVLGHMKNMGYEMIKIDFLTHGAIEGDHFYDPTVTTGMQAYRKGMELVDSVLDGSMLVYAAISPNLATARYVHMRRIACDAFSAIDNSEYTLNSTGYGWWQGNMYNYVDADHVVFTTAPDNMNRARLASSLVTGTLTTGDDFASYGKWKGVAQLLLQNKNLLAIAKQGKSFRPVDANTGNRGVHVFTRELNGQRYVALFNYSDKPQTYDIPFNRAGITNKATKALELFTDKVLPLQGNTLQITVPASDAVIYRVE